MCAGRLCTHAVLLRNTGLLPATARVSMAPHGAFELSGGERHVALAPSETQPVSIAFRPATAGRHTHQACSCISLPFMRKLCLPSSEHQTAIRLDFECHIQRVLPSLPLSAFVHITAQF